jgi:hypothetical protein
MAFWKPLKLALGAELETFSVIWLLLLTVAVIAASAYLAAQPYNLGA